MCKYSDELGLLKGGELGMNGWLIDWLNEFEIVKWIPDAGYKMPVCSYITSPAYFNLKLAYYRINEAYSNFKLAWYNLKHTKHKMNYAHYNLNEVKNGMNYAL